MIELLPTDQFAPQDFAKMSFSALFFKSKVRYDIAILKLLQSIYPARSPQYSLSVSGSDRTWHLIGHS